jgi:lysozyme
MGGGSSRPRLFACVGLLVLALIAATVTVAAARAGSAAGGARLTVSKPVVGAQGTVRLRGFSWPCRRDVRLEAYVDGVSPYASQDIGVVKLAGAAFSKRWRVPPVIDSVPWTVQAVQRCGARAEVVTAPLEITASARGARTAGFGWSQLSAGAASAGATTVDRRGLQYIADNEGYKLNSQGQYVVYNDPLGFCTAGYGHLLHKSNCTAADLAGAFNNLSASQAVALLQMDANSFAAYIVGRTQVPISQAQLDALVDFAFNVGQPAYGGSTLLRLLNQGQVDQVPGQLARWVHGTVGNGANKHVKVLKGLVLRRGTESKMWTNGQFPTAKHPLPTPGGLPPPPPTTTTPTTPTPTPANCSSDNLSQPPPDGCYRVKVQVILDYYPGDTQHGLGVGVGSATVEPGGGTIACLNPGNAGACFVYEDVAVNTTVTVTATPGSLASDSSAGVDSMFEKFAGSCTGTGACVLTPSSNNTVVDVYFIPAVAKLTLDASPQHGPEMIANTEGPPATSNPLSPVYCGSASYDTMSLSCSLLVRINQQVQVSSAFPGAPTGSNTPTFSNNCPARPADPSYCDITLTSDQTVTASYGG